MCIVQSHFVHCKTAWCALIVQPPGLNAFNLTLVTTTRHGYIYRRLSPKVLAKVSFRISHKNHPGFQTRYGTGYSKFVAQCSAQGIQQGNIQDITQGIEQTVKEDIEQVPSRYQIMYPVGYRHGINQGIAKDIAEVLPKVYIAKYITFSSRGESSTY